MKITRAVGKAVKPFVDVPTWLGYSLLRDSTKGIVSLFKHFFVPAKATREETFEEALQRLNLTEEDIQESAHSFTRLTILWVTLAIIILCYAFYLLWNNSLHGFFASFAICLIALAQAFRYHFWLFQVKQRRLGCSFREWLNANFIGNKQ